MHHLPVDHLVVVDDDVAKANGPLQAVGQLCWDDPFLPQQVKGLSHGGGCGGLRGGDQMSANVHAQLDGAAQIEGDDVLEIDIRRQVLGLIGALVGHPLHAAAQGLQLLLDYLPIHATRLSCRMRLRRGMKSA
jgi:hypothetical protein